MIMIATFSTAWVKTRALGKHWTWPRERSKHTIVAWPQTCVTNQGSTLESKDVPPPRKDRPLRKLTYPTLGKGKSLTQMCRLVGHILVFQECNGRNSWNLGWFFKVGQKESHMFRRFYHHQNGSPQKDPSFESCPEKQAKNEVRSISQPWKPISFW